MSQEQTMEPTAEAMPLFTPVNLILFSLALYIAYIRLRPAQHPTIPSTDPIVFKTFTPRTLLPHNGTDDPRIYMSVRGKVFDVSPGKGFYGPGGPYNVFAGRDASRGLAKGDLDESLLTRVDERIDRLEDLTEGEKEALQGWIEQFEGKYLEVGELVNEDKYKE